jgi:O-succinylbenzoic acid--CoA ligase
MTRTAPDPLLERVAHDPEALALHARSATWTRAQLLDAADGLARGLLAARVEQGSRVACLLADDAPAVALVHALRRLGAVHVPLDRRATAAERRYQLELVAADLLLADADHLAAAHSSAPAATPVEAVEALLAGAPCGPAAGLRDEVDLEAPATIVFTSGTTGRPKGAVLSHDNHRASAHAWAGLLRPGPGQRWLACLPLYHVAGLAMVTRTTRWGAPLQLLDSFDAGTVSAALDDGVTHLSLVPVQLERLLAVRERRPVPDTLVAILLGGGPLPLGSLTRARAAGYRVLTSYGLTETASGVASGGADAATVTDPAAGRALPGVELRVEPDGAADGSGEILVRGPMVFSGYLGDPAATAEALRGGWLHTGDLGTLDGGLLRIVDRRHDLIVSGGENVYPAEVEAVLAMHPAVVEAGVYGVPHERWGAVPAAAVVVAGDGPDDAELDRHCREHLAGYKVPTRFVRVPGLPYDELGKLRRHLLRERVGEARG